MIDILNFNKKDKVKFVQKLDHDLDMKYFIILRYL